MSNFRDDNKPKLKKSSSAPPPISPLRGGRSTRMAVALPPANWDFWSQKLNARLWEAVALSLDIEPRQTTPRQFENNGKLFLLGNQSELVPMRDRLEIAIDHIGKTLRPVMLHGDPHFHDVALSDFAAWALAMSWDIPAPLRAMSNASIRREKSVIEPSRVNERAAKLRSLKKILECIERRAAGKKLTFKRDHMPGRRADFQECCRKHDPKSFFVGKDTFNEYLTGICKFTPGSRQTSFYRDLFPELSWKD